MIKAAIPVFCVESAARANEFYCDRLGFTLEFAHNHDGGYTDPCYMGLSRDGVWLIVSSFVGRRGGSVANLWTDDVAAYHREFVRKNVKIDDGHPVARRPSRL
jgi:hypothetical protein